MGGNVFDGVGTIYIDEIPPTLDYISQKTDIAGISARLLGSTGKKEYSGDIDLAIETYTKEETFAFIDSLKFAFGEDNVRKIGTLITTKVPIQDYDQTKNERQPRTGYVQVDYIFGNLRWLQLYYHSPYSGESKLKGTHRNIALSTLAGYTDRIASSDVDDKNRPIEITRYKWSPRDGLVRVQRNSWRNPQTGDWIKKQKEQLLSDPIMDADEIARVLFNGKAGRESLTSVEAIVAATKLVHTPELQDRIFHQMARNFQIHYDVGSQDWEYPVEIATHMKEDPSLYENCNDVLVIVEAKPSGKQKRKNPDAKKVYKKHSATDQTKNSISEPKPVRNVRPNAPPMTVQDLKTVESKLNGFAMKMGFEFSLGEEKHHFMDQINNPRNKGQITSAELFNLFGKLLIQHKDKLKLMAETGKQPLVVGLSSDIYSPLMFFADRKTIGNRRVSIIKIITKTIMRTAERYKSSSPRIHVKEQLNLIILHLRKKLVTLNESHEYTNNTEFNSSILKSIISELQRYNTIGQNVGWGMDAQYDNEELDQVANKLMYEIDDLVDYISRNPGYEKHPMVNRILFLADKYGLMADDVTNEADDDKDKDVSAGGRYATMKTKPKGYLNGSRFVG